MKNGTTRQIMCEAVKLHRIGISRSTPWNSTAFRVTTGCISHCSTLLVCIAASFRRTESGAGAGV